MNLNELKEETDVLYPKLCRKIMDAFADEFKSRPELSKGGQQQIVFQMTYLTALVDVASVIAVDSGVSLEMFKSIADENFKNAFERAPKFG